MKKTITLKLSQHYWSNDNFHWFRLGSNFKPSGRGNCQSWKMLKKGNKQKQERKQGTKEKKDKRKKKTGNEKHLQSARHILQRTAKNVSSNRPSFSFSSAFLYLFLSCFVFPFFWSSQRSPEGSETSLNPVSNTEKHPLRMNPSI